MQIASYFEGLLSLPDWIDKATLAFAIPFFFVTLPFVVLINRKATTHQLLDDVEQGNPSPLVLPVSIATFPNSGDDHDSVTDSSFRVYNFRLDMIEDIIAELNKGFTTLDVYCRVYYSELIRHGQFENAIKSNLDEESSRRTITFYNTDYEDEPLVKRLYQIEDPFKERWNDWKQFQSHLLNNGYTRNVNIAKRIERNDLKDQFYFRQYHTNTHLSQFSIVRIDGEKYFVALHSAGPGLRYGRDMPSVFVDANNTAMKNWQKRLDEELEQMNTSWSRLEILGVEN